MATQVRQYNELRKKWQTHEFETHREARHYVLNHKLIGWTSRYIYIVEKKEEEA